MTIKVYRIKIEGYVIDHDFYALNYTGPRTTPADWDRDQLLALMSGNCTVTETLVDAIEDEEE